MTEKSNLLAVGDDKSVSSELYSAWIKAVSEVRKIDHRTDSFILDPEKINLVTISVPAWVAAQMHHRCPTCGWPIYVINIGPSQYHYCTNPECSHCTAFDSISSHLQNQDRIIQERRERIRVRKAERERKVEEDRKQEQLIESRIRQILFSYGIRVRRKTKT
jgi:hypothetical protein